MKKGLLVCLSIAVSIGAIAQSAVRLPAGFRKAEASQSMKNYSVKVPYRNSIDDGTPSNNVQSRRYTAPTPPTMADSEDVIGTTFYDLQTNSAVLNRIVRNDDGTASAVWTFSPDAIQTPSIFPNRGTGYNYFDGTSWGPQPTSRIDAVRTGWTNVCVTASGKEMTIQHYGQGLCLNWRAQKGTGAWTTSYPWGQGTSDTWPKAIAAGENVYAIWQGSGTTGVPVNGQDGPIFFSRSTDGGVTWSARTIIPGVDSSFYLGFGGDEYSIDADVNGNVAIVYSGITNDVGLLKSTDFGQTFTRTIVQTFPIPFYDANTMLTDTNNDGVVDTLNSNSSDAHVMLDNNGMAHVWFSDYRWYNDLSTPGSWNYFPSTDGLFYWNETMASDAYVLIAAAEDFNGNGTLDAPLDETCSQPWGIYRGGLTQMPSAGIDANGTIYLAYQTINEAADTTFYHQAHRHVYMMALAPPYDPANWTVPYNIVPSIAEGGDGENQEAVFARIAKKVDATGEAWVVYQRDNAPGHALAAAGTCDVTNNLGNASDIICARITASTVDINSLSEDESFVSQNYPNPAVNQTFINVVLKKTADVSVTVTDMVGKTVHSEVRSSLGAGSHTIGLNTSNWSSGVYSYTVIAGGQKTTRQMIVR